MWVCRTAFAGAKIDPVKMQAARPLLLSNLRAHVVRFFSLSLSLVTSANPMMHETASDRESTRDEKFSDQVPPRYSTTDTPGSLILLHIQLGRLIRHSRHDLQISRISPRRILDRSNATTHRLREEITPQSDIPHRLRSSHNHPFLLHSRPDRNHLPPQTERNDLDEQPERTTPRRWLVQAR